MSTTTKRAAMWLVTYGTPGASNEVLIPAESRDGAKRILREVWGVAEPIISVRAPWDRG